MRTLDWTSAIVAIRVLWLVLMVVASCLSCEHKLPVRIESWKPQPTPP